MWQMWRNEKMKSLFREKEHPLIFLTLIYNSVKILNKTFSLYGICKVTKLFETDL